MSESIVDISHAFFDQVVMPILQEKFPEETRQMTFGLFGLGSEAIRLDDEFSRDHHWGIRIDTLMPVEIFEQKREHIMKTVGAQIPSSFQGHKLQEGIHDGAGFAPDNMEWFLKRTIGLDHAPQTPKEWLEIPEEDITHVINGEIWYDADGRFTAIRKILAGYYPEEVWLRRIAHWCRYYSGMGTYSLKRAMLRNNEHYANITFSRAIRLGVQLAFLLEKTYFPYDKWTYTAFQKLPRMVDRMGAFVDEAVKLSTDWDRKLELLAKISDVLDATMVEDGVIPPHPKYIGSPTSGYRLMEAAYQQIIKRLPPEIQTTVPLWDQIHLERFVSGYVAGIEVEPWLAALNLSPAK